MLEAGSKVAQYRLEGLLGQGGMGEVYAAFDERLERRVALKFLPAERELDLVARGRMLREARAASALKHPGIVTIYEIGEAEGRAFIAMELVEGETLAQLAARRAPLPPAEAVELVRRVGDALTAAHEAGILHRDVKTANLMIDARGHVKVLDFGLSKRVAGGGTPSSPPTPVPPPPPPSQPTTEADSLHAVVDPSAPTALPTSLPALPSPAPTPGRALPTSEPVTAHGVRMGTPGSAAPELMRGQEADRRSDVFSLGVVLYELVCGRRPFRGPELRALIDAVANERYEPASTVNPAVGPRLDAVITRALKARREERFATIAEMVAAAEAAVGVGGRHPRRGRALLAAGGAALAIAAAFGIWRAASGGGGGDAPAPSAKATGAAALVPPAPGRAAPGAARALTSLGGCAYAPTFADEDTVVFDFTDAEGANHLWSVPAAGGAPRQLTSGALVEWRPMSGRRPGEVVYLVNDPTSNTGERAGVFALDLATGVSQRLTAQVASSAAFVGDTLHYVRRDGAELRRVRDGVDEAAATWKNSITAKLMAVAPGGARLAFTAVVAGTLGVCILEPDADAPRCLERAVRLVPGRPVWSTDGTGVYYASVSGVRRVRADDGADDLVVPETLAVGGVSVSPSGARLVYSDCNARGALLDTGVTPPRALTPVGSISHPGAGPAGVVAYVTSVNGGYALFVRDAGGTTRQLAGPFAGRVTQPRFSADGKRIAFVVAGLGLHVQTISDTQLLTPVPVATGSADEDPAWLPDGRLVFTRREGPSPGAHVLDPAGGEAAPLTPVPRRVVGATASGRVLLLSIDATQFIEWDPKARKERPARFSPEALGRVVGVALAPGGRWLAVQSGDRAQRVYRYDLAAARPQAELAFEAGKGQTLGTIAISDEGHVLAAPQVWSGEIYAVDAAEGTRF